MLETNDMHLSVNGAVYANGLRLGTGRPGCIRLLTSTIHYQEPVKDRLAASCAAVGPIGAGGDMPLPWE